MFPMNSDLPFTKGCEGKWKKGEEKEVKAREKKKTSEVIYTHLEKLNLVTKIYIRETS